MRASGLENEVGREWDGWVTSYESVHFLRVAVGLKSIILAIRRR